MHQSPDRTSLMAYPFQSSNARLSGRRRHARRCLTDCLGSGRDTARPGYEAGTRLEALHKGLERATHMPPLGLAPFLHDLRRALFQKVLAKERDRLSARFGLRPTPGGGQSVRLPPGRGQRHLVANSLEVHRHQRLAECTRRALVLA